MFGQHRLDRRHIGALLSRMACGALVFIASMAKADEALEVTWTRPYAVESGSDGRRNTFDDGTREWLINHLPGYKHTITVATALRTMALLRSEDAVCYPTLVKTPERLEFVAFSDPLYWSVPARVIALASSAGRFQPLLGHDGAIPFARLLADRSFIGAHEVGRAFTPAIQGQLDRTGDNDHLIGGNKGVSIYALLATSRVDWVLGYVTDAYETFLVRYPDLSLTSFAIAGSDQPLEVFAGCSKTAHGIAIVGAIDTELRQHPGGYTLQSLYEQRLDPDTREWLHKAIAK